MPKYITTNKDYSYKIDFIVDGEYISPSSANITLTKNDSSVVGGINQTALTIATDATSATYLISASNNIKTLDTEIRYITVNFTHNAKPYTIKDFYQVVAALEIPVSTADVKNIIGLSDKELPDEMIDIYAAFNDVTSETDSAGVDTTTILTTGSSLLPALQEAVKFKAAINSLLGIETLILQSEQADNTIYKRFSTIDFNEILARLNNKYNAAILKLSGVGAGEAATSTLLIISTGTDRITNA
jgi:hypothetical protein